MTKRLRSSFEKKESYLEIRNIDTEVFFVRVDHEIKTINGLSVPFSKIFKKDLFTVQKLEEVLTFTIVSENGWFLTESENTHHSSVTVTSEDFGLLFLVFGEERILIKNTKLY